MGVLWEGSFFVHHSLANVNCEVAALLARHRDIELGLIPFEPHQFDEQAHARYRPIAARFGHRPRTVRAHVRHRWPPDFTRPDAAVHILVQPWEFGWLPVAWVDAIRDGVDEVWVHTTFVRDAYLRSGVDPERVETIPLGVNPTWFHPSVPPHGLRTRGTFRFLFVGGSLPRKGFDLLLQAYVAEFTRSDDVCLVIKDFHYGDVLGDFVRSLGRRRTLPEIHYTYGNTHHHELGGLYTACDCYVHPYRAEGFGLPILEAMACGLPVIVTGRGAALDFCTGELAYLIPATETPFPRRRWPRRLPTVQPVTWAEPDAHALRRLMRHVFEHRDEARQKGALAAAHVRRHFTWRRTADAMIQRLERWRSRR